MSRANGDSFNFWDNDFNAPQNPSSRRNSIFKDIFTNNPNLGQTSGEKIFAMESNPVAKRKSISFCMNEENMKDMTFYQNYFNSDVPFPKTGEANKSGISGSGLVPGLGPAMNASGGLMNNSSFNLLFGHTDEGTRNANKGSFMVDSGDKQPGLVMDNFAIPNLAPQESQYAGLRRNLRNYNRSRHTDSENYKNGSSFGSNDSLSNLQRNLKDFRLGGSRESSSLTRPIRRRAQLLGQLGRTPDHSRGKLQQNRLGQ